MGTNYYFKSKCCPTCGHTKEVRHIGKSSGGWCFALHVYPDEGIASLDDWKRLFMTAKHSHIEDEYGERIGTSAMLSVITERSSDRWDHDKLEANHACPGPNGLARHVLDQPEGGSVRKSFTSGCVAHGAGTWDCLVGSEDSW